MKRNFANVNLKRLTLPYLIVPLLVSSLLLAHAQEFAELTVESYGDEILDIATGITTLPEGGHVIDRRSDITLSSGFVRYEEGNFVEARGVEGTTPHGSFQAEAIYLNIAAQTLYAEGDTYFESDSLSLAFDMFFMHMEQELAFGSGNARGSRPEFEAPDMLIDFDQSIAFLTAPYTYKDGIFTLRGNNPEDALEFAWQAPQNDDDSVDFEVNSDIDVAHFQQLKGFQERHSIH